MDFESLLASKERNRKKKKYFPDYWLSRNYLPERSIELAKYHYFNNLPEEDRALLACETCWKIDFWLARGYTQLEATEKTSGVQKRNSERILSKYSKEERKKFKTTSIEYYLERGYSKEEAEKLVSERQATFSREICIKKHGVEAGEVVFKSRQEKWQRNLLSKTEEERAEINKRKGMTLDNFVRKHGKEIGEKLYFDWVIDYKKRLTRNGLRNYSKESIDWLKSFIPTDILDNAKIMEDELFLHDGKKVYFYDFNFKKVIIEYHGEVYHYNQRTNKENWVSPFGVTKEESLKKDFYKKQLAESKGFKYFEYYSNDSKEYELNLKQTILKALYEENNYQIVQPT